MRVASTVLAVAVGLVAVGAGCEAQNPALRAPCAAEDDSAPRRTLLAWHQALVGGDRQQYLACFAGTEDELVLVLAAFEVVEASETFHDAVVAAYGEDAWRSFERADGARVARFPRESDWPMRITLVRTGVLAFGYLPGGRVPLHLVEDRGVWRIQAASLIPPGQTAEKAAYYLFRWSAALRELAQRVGRPGEPAAPLRPDAPRGALEEKLEAGELKQADEAIHYMMMH
jgi:hypothetical protein